MDVTRRQAQKELQKYGYEVGILNIAMTSETSISVKEIHMPFLGSNTVSLVIEKAPQQKAVLKDIFIEPYHVAVKETDIEHLSEETENAFNEFLALEELRGQTEWVLLDAGITIASQNVRIDGDRIIFSSGKYYSWTLSGTADPEQQIFPLISRDNREFLRDIHFDDLRETLRLELMKINPDIFQKKKHPNFFFFLSHVSPGIIITVGPACEHLLQEMQDEGVSVFRLNLSHGNFRGMKNKFIGFALSKTGKNYVRYERSRNSNGYSFTRN